MSSCFSYLYIYICLNALLGNRTGRKDLHWKHEAVEEYLLRGIREPPLMATDLPLSNNPPGEGSAKLQSSVISSSTPTITTANKTAKVPISTIRPSTEQSKRPFTSKTSGWSSKKPSSRDSSSIESLPTITGPEIFEQVIVKQSVKSKPFFSYATAEKTPKRGRGYNESVPKTDEQYFNSPPTTVGTKLISAIVSVKNGATAAAKAETAIEASALNDSVRIPSAGRRTGSGRTKVDVKRGSDFRVSVTVIRGGERERDVISPTVQAIFCGILERLESAGALPKFLQSLFDAKTCLDVPNLYGTESSRDKTRIRRQIPDNDPCRGPLGKYSLYL